MYKNAVSAETNKAMTPNAAQTTIAVLPLCLTAIAVKAHAIANGYAKIAS